MNTAHKKIINQPRYAWLRESILEHISNGNYPVGSLLPPENQLAEIYGVSRHTVREATRKLAESGQISRHPGIGTIVRSTSKPEPFVAALGTAKNLIEYTNATRLEVLDSRDVTADAKLAEALGCEVGSQWREIDAFRHATGQSAPISFSQVYLRPEFADIENLLRGDHMSIYSMLEAHYGISIHAVKQGIEATLMPLAAARLLGVRARSPALYMNRSYLGQDGRVLAVSSNLYAAERFKLETYWNQDQEEPKTKTPSQTKLRSPQRPGGKLRSAKS